jgi:hypothetical protein
MTGEFMRISSFTEETWLNGNMSASFLLPRYLQFTWSGSSYDILLCRSTTNGSLTRASLGKR